MVKGSTTSAGCYTLILLRDAILPPALQYLHLIFLAVQILNLAVRTVHSRTGKHTVVFRMLAKCQ